VSDTLLTVLRKQFNVAIDPESDPGKILDTLTPLAPLGIPEPEGDASLSKLAFVPTSSGLSVRAAEASDILVWQIPDQTAHFKILPAQGGNPLRVEVTLLPLKLPLPELNPAQLGPDGMPQAAGNDKVNLILPGLVLAVTEKSARLAAAQVGGGSLQVTMQPPLALIGPGTVLAFGFDQAILKLDGPEGPQIQAPSVQLFISPPAIQALQMHGNANNLFVGLGANGGVSGDFTLAQDQGAVAPARPSFIDHLSARLRLDRSAVVLLEISGQVNFRTAVTDHVAGLDGVEGPDVVICTLRLMLDTGWRVGLWIAAAEGQGFLWRTRGTQASLPRDTLGAFAAFAPLLNSATAGGSGGDIVDLALGTGVAGALAGAGVAHSNSVTLYGGEMVVSQQDATTQAFLFFDVETEVSVDAQVIATTHPIRVRQKAIGVRLDFGTGLHPVFDTGRGYNLDLSDPGLFKLQPDFLADILQPDRPRMSRSSPLNLELDLLPRLDLGVVKVDKTSVRIPIESHDLPSLTGLGVSLDVPGLMQGCGYLQFTNGGFFGQLDATLAQLGVRVTAGLALRKITPDTAGFLATLGVDFPIPIILGSTGLGIFGFLGLFGMHYRRNMAENETVLGWYRRADGDLTKVDPSLWATQLNHWSLGLGTVLGTIEGGYLLNLKGALVIEVPGPELLIFMNASVLWPRPQQRGTSDMGTLLAVIKLSPSEFLVGLAINYNIEPLLEIYFPVEGRFAGTNDWAIDLGTIDEMVTVKFLFTLRVSGYLMIHGKGIAGIPRLLPPNAYPVAAGVRAAMTWGPEEIGLYLKVAAQADVGISFKPFLITGQMSINGELHLFIVSIEVSADAKIRITPSSFYVFAEVCGEVDFFFFSVEGCVKLELGDPPPLPPADPLVRAVSIHSRSSALLPGSGVDRPVDGSLGEALRAGDMSEPLVVPIDAIPVIQFEMRPVVDPACKPLGTPVDARVGPNDWVQRGGRFYRYILKSVDVSGEDAQHSPLNPPVTVGDRPNVWWDRSPAPGGGNDNDVQLALLDWIPDPTPAAAQRSLERDDWLKHRWGNLCVEIARPAGVLWTFLLSPFGPQSSGWTLKGIASPDPDKTFRSAQPPFLLKVTEPWRGGNLLADALPLVTPARVTGGLFPGRSRGLLAPFMGADKVTPRVQGDARFDALFELARPNELENLMDGLRVDLGPSVFVRLLLFARPSAIDAATLVLETLDSAGNKLGNRFTLKPGAVSPPAICQILTPASNPAASLPPSWLTKPWLDEVSPFLTALQQDEWQLVLFETPLDPRMAQIDLGLTRAVDKLGSSWGILVVEALGLAEMMRFDFDDQSKNSTLKTINGALSADQQQRALLQPGATYTVTVSYEVDVAEVDEHGNPGPVDHQTPDAQKFTFRTDNEPPKRLDPWVLATDPGPDEAFFFWGDPVRVIFSSPAVRKLFKAYGKDLFAVVRAANNHPPPGNIGFDPAKVSLAATVKKAVGLPTTVFTPWESSMKQILAGQDCVEEVNDDNRHEQIRLTLELDPLTNFVLDITTDPNGLLPASPLFRLGFSTSRFASMKDLAAAVKSVPPQHRFLEDVSPLTKLSSDHPGAAAVQIPDLDLEMALRSAQWGDLGPTAKPRVSVIWQDGGGDQPPQPTAVLIETTEPLWRQRKTPAEITGEDQVKQFTLQPETLLDLTDTSAGGALVTRFIFSPGGGRTLVLLKAAARGGQLTLALNRYHCPLFEFELNSNVETTGLLDVSLAVAPWEEQG
jgi:hypothetical protein